MTGKRFIFKYINEEHISANIYDNNTFIGSVSIGVELIVYLLNELHEENHIKLEIVDAFILGMEDEKGIAPEDKEFQCRMNHTIRVLKRLKEDMLNPTEFKRLKEVKE